MGYWEAYAEYADGERVLKKFPYREHGNYNLECERQYELETWLMEYHHSCTYYSVNYVEEDE